jgi:hypothetical protein
MLFLSSVRSEAELRRKGYQEGKGKALRRPEVVDEADRLQLVRGQEFWRVPYLLWGRRSGGFKARTAQRRFQCRTG